MAAPTYSFDTIQKVTFLTSSGGSKTPAAVLLQIFPEEFRSVIVALLCLRQSDVHMEHMADILALGASVALPAAGNAPLGAFFCALLIFRSAGFVTAENVENRERMRQVREFFP